MMLYTPDYWQVIEICPPNTPKIYKVFATWLGGYTVAEEWRLNSGISAVRINENVIEFDGFSESVYKVPFFDHCYRTSLWSHSILLSIIKKLEESGIEYRILPFETDWLKLNVE
jgi:hypothetical protein